MTTMAAMNQTPSKDHGADFSRVRTFCLNGWGRAFRQTVVLAPYVTPDTNALFREECASLRGRVRISHACVDGVVQRIAPKVRQLFQRMADCGGDPDEARLQYFTHELMPKLRKSAVGQGHTLVYVPSYFDYVRLRNWFREVSSDVERMQFVVLSEYTEPGDVTRNRAKFRDGGVDYALCTERFHYYHRYQLKGLKHIIFYALPTIAGFYSELLNLLPPLGSTTTALISKYDGLALQRVVGSARAAKMLSAPKDTHLLV